MVHILPTRTPICLKSTVPLSKFVKAFARSLPASCPKILNCYPHRSILFATLVLGLCPDEMHGTTRSTGLFVNMLLEDFVSLVNHAAPPQRVFQSKSTGKNPCPLLHLTPWSGCPYTYKHRPGVGTEQGGTQKNGRTAWRSGSNLPLAHLIGLHSQ